MGFMSRLGLKKPRDAPQFPDIQENVRDSGNLFVFGMTHSGERVDERTAMQIVTVYACVRLLTTAFIMSSTTTQATTAIWRSHSSPPTLQRRFSVSSLMQRAFADGINANTSVVNDAVNSFAGGLAEKISSVIQNALSNVVTSVQGFMTQVFDTVKTVWTNANAAIDATMAQISSGITSGWKTIVSTIKTALESIRNIITTTWKAVSSAISAALDGIKKIITAVWTTLKNLIKTGQLDINNVISTTWNAAKDVVNTALNAIKSVVQAIWNAMPDIVRNPMNQLKDAVLSIWDNIKNGIGDRLGGVRDAVTNAMNAVYSAVMDKVNSSWSWGRDLMQNLINGITYMLGSLINTVADVARSIWEYLHFSVPEKGALTDVEEWMPDFMKGLAKGIEKSKKYVEAAVSGVADAMTLTMQSGLSVDMDGISGAMMNSTPTGTVINNYNNDNSRTVNQTNNSPKSLSRLEIYRMTRNALG